MVHLEKVLSHDRDDGLVFDELKDLVPETLGLRDRAPPVEVKSLRSLEITGSPHRVVQRFGLNEQLYQPAANRAQRESGTRARARARARARLKKQN